YFKHKEYFEKKRELEEAADLNTELITFRQESAPFQLVYITTCGWSSAILLSTVFNYFRLRRQGWRGTSMLEPMTRPFIIATFSSALISFCAGLAYVYYNKLEDERPNSKP